MFKNIRSILLSFFLLLSIAFSACKNNPTISPAPAPSLLQLTPFYNNFPPFPFYPPRGPLPDEINFYSASDKVNSSLSMIHHFMFEANNSFLQGNESTPYYEEDKWIWEWNNTLPTLAVVKVNAEVTQEQTHWELIETFPIRGGKVIEDFKRFSGFVNTDSTMGEWTLFVYREEVEIPAMQINWTSSNDSDLTLKVSVANFDFFQINGFVYSKFTLTKNSPFNTAVLTAFDSKEFEIFWNENTRVGYFKEDSQPKLCWDENIKNVECIN